MPQPPPELSPALAVDGVYVNHLHSSGGARAGGGGLLCALSDLRAGPYITLDLGDKYSVE